MVGQKPDHLHLIGAQPDFFLCLAQCCGRRPCILCFDVSAGKSHLPGVVAQTTGTHRQQHSRSFGSVE